MAQLNVRLDDDTRDSFDALARARGLSASDLIRNLIDNALGREESSRRHGDLVPPSLSAIERRAFILQHEILAHLTSESDEPNGGWDAEYHRGMVEVLNRGFTTEYDKMFQEVQPEMTRREASLAHDILDMFDNIQWSLSRLTEAERATLGENAENALTFSGFDFNDSQEGRLADFAQYVIKTGRWESMAIYFDDKHERGNSHFPALASYQRLLAVWQPMRQAMLRNYGGPNKYALGPDELRQIVEAWPYPRAVSDD